MYERLGRSLALCLAVNAGDAAAEITWGVNGHPFTAYPGIPFEQQLDLVKGMHATSYRVNISFAEQAAEMARLIEAARPRGITILPVLTPGGMDMATESPQDLYRKAREFAVVLAEQFKDDIPVWELGNELENFAILQPCERSDDGSIYPCDWGPAGGVKRLDYYGPRWVKVSAVLRGLTEGVASVDPTLRRAIGTAGWGHVGAFERMSEEGLQWEISIWHAYGEDPEWAFDHLAKYGRPIWLTEFNHPFGSRDGDEAMTNGLQQMMNRLIELEARYDIEGAHIYELLDEPYWAPSFEATMGLVPLGPTADGGWTPLPPRPAYYAVRDIAASYVPPCDLDAAAAIQPLTGGQAAYAHCLVLGKLPSADQLANWSAAFAGGQATTLEMVESLIRSPDFRARYAPAIDDAGYITSVYRQFLRREPDGYGRESYSQQLGDGSLTREDLALATIRSSEFAERHPLLFQAPATVSASTDILARDCDLAAAATAAASVRRAAYAYCLLLGRDPDQAETEAAAQTLEDGASTSDLLRSLLESAEFAARYQIASLGDQEYVRLAYRLLLDREPDGIGRDGYVAALGAGSLSRDRMTAAVAESGEFADRHPALLAPPPVAPLPLMPTRDCDLDAAAAIAAPTARRIVYAHCLILGTAPAPDALQALAEAIDAGDTAFADLLDGLIGSDDFKARYKSEDLTDDEFVVLVYEVLLGRQPDGLGLRTYAEQLANGYMAREEVARSAVWSSEFAALHPALAE